MPYADVLTIVLSIHALSIPIAITAARNYGDRSEWLQKSLSGVDALLLRLRQTVAEALRAKLTAVPTTPGTSPFLLDTLGNPYATENQLAVQGEAFRDAVHDLVRENIGSLRSYSTVLGARDAWAWWARVVSWSALLLVGWQLTAGSVVLSVKVFQWAWTPRMLFLTLLPTATFVVGMLIGLAGTALAHDRIMDVRKTNDPL